MYKEDHTSHIKCHFIPRVLGSFQICQDPYFMPLRQHLKKGSWLSSIFSWWKYCVWFAWRASLSLCEMQWWIIEWLHCEPQAVQRDHITDKTNNLIREATGVPPSQSRMSTGSAVLRVLLGSTADPAATTQSTPTLHFLSGFVLGVVCTDSHYAEVPQLAQNRQKP